MRYYETTFIARQDLAQNQVQNLEKHFSDLIKKLGGEIKFTENWGLRQLAYRINKNKKGHYIFMCLHAKPECIFELERQMRLHEDVLRYLTVHVEKQTETPTPMLKDRLRDDQKANSFETEKKYKTAGHSQEAETSESVEEAGKADEKKV